VYFFPFPPSLLGFEGFLFSSLMTLLFPLRIHPFTDGYSWPRREGYKRHAGVRQGEELTDNDDDEM
jgi:hypothetical protein